MIDEAPDHPAAEPPSTVVWDITYACPLRCAHCYSESGRRPSRALSGRDLHRVCDALIELGSRTVVLSGGEPLVLPQLLDVIAHLHAAGVSVQLYTGGWPSLEPALPAIVERVANVTVSIDGALAATHDRIRGRLGSFERALATLATLDAVARSASGPTFGVDYTVMRSNITEMEVFCTTVVPQFDRLHFVFFGAVMPIGLASRQSFADHELLDEQQLERLRSDELHQALRCAAPPHIDIGLSDNGMFQMHPDRLAAGEIPAMQVEPDGRVRAMPVYEGTVGSLLEDSPIVLWQRAVERWRDPMVSSRLRAAATAQQWAGATRALDVRFGSPADRLRIQRRPVHRP